MILLPNMYQLHLYFTKLCFVKSKLISKQKKHFVFVRTNLLRNFTIKRSSIEFYFCLSKGFTTNVYFIMQSYKSDAMAARLQSKATAITEHAA